MNKLRPSVPGDIPALRRLWKEAFGDSDAYLDLFFQTAYAPERSIVMTGEDSILGGAYWLDCTVSSQKLAYVYAVAITASRQGQGLGTQLMNAIHTRLAAQGYAGALLVPGSPRLWSYYRRFGYRTAAHRSEFQTRAAGSIFLSPISAQRYAMLRRRYLPENGVVQEKEHLSLLAGFARFYEGADFIAAVSPEEKNCLELLPNAKHAPAVTAALGFEQCRFRTPGREVAYAMVKPLGSAVLPAELYLGFGFD